MASIQRIKSPLTGAISYRAQVRVKGRPAQSETFPNTQGGGAVGRRPSDAAIRENRHHPHLAAGKTSFEAAVTRLPRPPRSSEAKEQSPEHPPASTLNGSPSEFKGLTLAEITADRVASARDALATETVERGKDKFDRKTGALKSRA